MVEGVPVSLELTDIIEQRKIPKGLRVRTFAEELSAKNNLDPITGVGLVQFANIQFRLADIHDTFNKTWVDWAMFPVNPDGNGNADAFILYRNGLPEFTEFLHHHAFSVYDAFLKDEKRAIPLIQEVQDYIQALFS